MEGSPVHILRAGAVVLYASGIQLLFSFFIGLCESRYGVLSTGPDAVLGNKTGYWIGFMLTRRLNVMLRLYCKKAYYEIVSNCARTKRNL